MEGEESNRLQFKFLIPEIGSYPEIFGQLIRHNINHRNHTISVITASGSEEVPITNKEN